MHFQKQDLSGKHYYFGLPEVKTPYHGHPSRRSFDRNNGDQVLFLINSFVEISERFSLREGRMIEYEIFHRLPLEVKSEVSVFNWLREIDFSHASNTPEIINL